MYKINKINITMLCFVENCSEDELMKKLLIFKCKRNYTDHIYYNKIKKNELCYVIKKKSYCIVINKSNRYFEFSIDKSINCEYFYDYFLTEKEMIKDLRIEKLIRIQQVSNSEILN